jgi:hypothetical protein
MHGNTSATDRQRKPLEPVRVRARFARGTTPRDLADGVAVLSVTEVVTRAVTDYWCEPLPGGGYRLRKFARGERYDLPADLSACSCGDRTHRPERPGGCKHMAALRQALPAVTKATA